MLRCELNFVKFLLSKKGTHFDKYYVKYKNYEKQAKTIHVHIQYNSGRLR